MGLDAYLMSFDLAWAKALDAGDQDALREFRKAARTVKVQFQLIHESLAVEKKKWERGVKSRISRMAAEEERKESQADVIGRELLKKRYAEGKRPSEVLSRIFSTYQSFEESGLNSFYGGEETGNNLFWVADLPEIQQQVLGFMASMMSFNPAISTELDAAVRSDYLIQAEAALARPGFRDKSLFDLAQASEALTEALAPCPETPACIQPGPEEKPDGQPVPEPEQTAEANWVPDEPEATSAHPPVESFFPHLLLSPLQKDVLQRVSFEKLQQAVEHANLRAAKNVTIIVGPPYVADFAGAHMDATDPRVHLHIWDPKSHLSNPSQLAHKFPYRFLPPVDLSYAKKCMGAIFAEQDGERIFRSSDASLWFDARVTTAKHELPKALAKELKALPKDLVPARPYVEFEFFYHNREHQVGHAKPAHSRSTVHACLPSHTELAYGVLGKSFSVPLKERKWIDVPGTNRSRGWSANSLLDEKDLIHVSYEVQQKLHSLSSAQKTVEQQLLESEDQEQKAGAEDQKTIPPDAMSMLWPWQVGEAFWKELYESLTANPCKDLLVMTGTPSAPGALAAARLGCGYVGWVASSLHKSVIMETAVLHITCDCLLGNRVDWGRRFLSRAASLNGTEAVPETQVGGGLQGAESQAQDEAATPRKENKQAEDGGCESSSSSDS
ncbi:unnamed protein product [Effrenium voratum]|uniref:Uncharacterized protein n=1 Tax=Effrenium voratum TaxID=2562239 RepID=A0AA36NFT3_9DINO|nr:unnamed protein product [Effrenium voratum]